MSKSEPIQVAAVKAEKSLGYRLATVAFGRPTLHFITRAEVGYSGDWDLTFASTLHAKQISEERGFVFMGFWDGCRFVPVVDPEQDVPCTMCPSCPVKTLLELQLA